MFYANIPLSEQFSDLIIQSKHKYDIKGLFGCYKIPLAIQTTVSGFGTAVFKPVALMAKGGKGVKGGGIYAAVLLFKMILMDVNFRKCVKRYLYVCLSRDMGVH